MKVLVVRRALALAFLSFSTACASGQLPPLGQAQIPNDSKPTYRSNAPMTQIGSGFKHPEGVAVDSAGNVYVADTSKKTVEKVAPPFTGPTHGTITTISRGFEQPAGIAVDAIGNIYVSDSGSNRVWLIKRSGHAQVFGRGFSSPEGLAVDNKGNVYVADYGNNRIAEVVAGSKPRTIMPVTTAGGADAAVSVDANGHVYGVNAIPGRTSKGWVQPNVCRAADARLAITQQVLNATTRGVRFSVERWLPLPPRRTILVNYEST